MRVSSPAELAAHPHRRHDPLTDRWVTVSAGRGARPWRGALEAVATVAPPAHDPTCALCPGVVRANGARTPDYRGTHAFPNDFAALRPDVPDLELGDGPLLTARTEAGACRVLCFSPRHDRSLGGLGLEGIGAVVDLWAEQETELLRRYRWVQVFENRGEGMGASSPHPHGQVWATASLPTEPAREDARQRDHRAATGRVLLDDYLALELARDERIVATTDRWVAVVPFWAGWPFETLILPRVEVARLGDLDDATRRSLAVLLGRLLGGYDALFGVPFPYSMGWHGAPAGADADVRHWRLHAHVLPPLLRSPTVRKWMVGFELLAEVQRDLTPEEAAARLAAVVPAETTVPRDPGDPADGVAHA